MLKQSKRNPNISDGATPAISHISTRTAWHTVDFKDCLLRLDSSSQGLTSNEANARLFRDGRNEISQEKPICAWTIFIRQFNSMLVWLLIVAAIISGMLFEWFDAAVIIFIVFLNAIIGFWQEFRAEHSIAALRKMTAPRAKVRRDDQVIVIPSSRIVRGDIVELEAGDLVPADARLLSANCLKCLESALTGESTSVEKMVATLRQEDLPIGNRSDMAFMGTTVVSGTGTAVVVATGMDTEVGGIVSLLEQAASHNKAPLETKLEHVGNFLVWACLALVVLLFVLGLLHHFRLFELFLTSISLAVAAVPEGLPAVVTIALGVGVVRMSIRNALIRRLSAIETMGCVSVICCDKTGTLTVGDMTVRHFYVAGESFEVTGEGYNPSGKIYFEGHDPTSEQMNHLTKLAEIMVGCNNAHITQEDQTFKAIGDPTEAAMLVAGQKLGVTHSKLDHNQPKIREIPFDCTRKYAMTTRVATDNKAHLLINGAPEMVLKLCTHIYTATGTREMSDEDRLVIHKQNLAMATRTLRVIASAYAEVTSELGEQASYEHIERNLIFVGLTGMYDPPRAEAKQAVVACRHAGIKVVLITGDQPHTAQAVAKELGIYSTSDGILTGQELEHLSANELAQKVANITVYARVTAEHKFRIVQAWRSLNVVCAMTGDGVNDAPALEAADIGVAMGRTGTEVAKQASDMIIADDNFASIVAAVEEGRGIYDNIRKTLQYLLAGNTGELLLMAACILSDLPLPLLPVHLLWINVVTDGLPALCLATDPVSKEVMKQSPRPKEQQIMDRSFLTTMAITGLLTGGISFAVFLLALNHGNLEAARTHAFTALVLAEIFRSFGVRSETQSLWQLGLLSNLRLTLVVAASFVLQIFIHHNHFLTSVMKTTILPWADSVNLIAIALIPLIFLELIKVVQRRTTVTNQSI